MKIKMQKREGSDDTHVIEVDFNEGESIVMSISGAANAIQVYKTIIYAYEVGNVYGVVKRAANE